MSDRAVGQSRSGITVDVLPRLVVEGSTLLDLDAWLAAQALPKDSELPIWVPSRSGAAKVRGQEHLAVLMSTLGKDSFASIEWRRPFPQPWAQTRPADAGFVVELNDGVVLPGNDHPCTRRAFRGEPGSYPLPDEQDPRYKTSVYPEEPMAIFGAMEGADLIWTWINTRALPDGISLTMRHFGAKERQSFGCGDL